MYLDTARRRNATGFGFHEEIPIKWYQERTIGKLQRGYLALIGQADVQLRDGYAALPHQTIC